MCYILEIVVEFLILFRNVYHIVLSSSLIHDYCVLPFRISSLVLHPMHIMKGQSVAERANRSLLSSVLCNFSANFILAVFASIAYFSRH